MKLIPHRPSGVDSGAAGGARAPPEFGGSEKGRGLISAYQFSYYCKHPGFEKLSTALILSNKLSKVTKS